MARSIGLGSAIVALAVMAAIGHGEAAEKIRWLNDWLPSGGKAAVYYGVQKGIFAKHGLEVEIASARGSADVVAKLAEGSADAGTGGLAALLEAQAKARVPVKAAMSIYTKQPDAIFTYPGSGIAGLADVVGKTVATAKFSSSNVVWPFLLRANGIDPASVQLVETGPGDLAAMLASGRVAATINWVTVAPAFEAPVRDAGKTLQILPWSDYGYHGYGMSLFLADGFSERQPEVARKLVSAYREALAGAIEDPKAAAAALKAMVPEVDEATVEKEWLISIPLMENEISRRDGVGAFEPQLLAKTWEWVAKSMNRAVDDLDPEMAVDRSLLSP